MRITVHAKPGAKKTAISRIAENEYEISVIEQPEKGRANDAVRRALADFLDIPQSRLSLVMGETSKTKVFEII